MVSLPVDKIDFHSQLPSTTCIPSAVEFILKQLGKVNNDYYDLQRSWTGDCFGYFDGRIESGLKFKHEFPLNLFPRGPNFPLDGLFEKISNELHAGRYVIISLETPDHQNWHMWIIYAEENNEFYAVSKSESISLVCYIVKGVVRNMKGTDILTYMPV